MSLYLPTEDVHIRELEYESSALPGAKAWIFTPTLAGGGSSTPMTQTITSSNGVAVTSSTPMLGAVGAVGASSTPIMEVAKKPSISYDSVDSLSFGRSFVCRTRGVDIFFVQDNPNFRCLLMLVNHRCLSFVLGDHALVKTEVFLLPVLLSARAAKKDFQSGEKHVGLDYLSLFLFLLNHRAGVDGQFNLVWPREKKQWHLPLVVFPWGTQN